MKHNILWDFKIQTNHQIPDRKPENQQKKKKKKRKKKKKKKRELVVS